MNSARPTNPADISFDSRCFVQDGVTVTWTVGGNLAPNYPSKFTNESDAVAYGARVGRPVSRVEAPRMRRVSWTVPA